MISRFFITRPIFACVISAFIVLAGLGGMRALPISAYPDIIPPQVTVSATYPGATAETIAETVAAPLEEEINGVEDMLYMQSVNAGNGTLAINVTFNVGADPDLAAINVNNRIQAAVPRLPEEVRRQGVVVRKASANMLQIVTIFSPDGSQDMLSMSSYASLNVLDELRRVKGVGDVQMFGQDYSIRIWMQPDKLAQLGLTPSDVAAAVRQQNSQFAAGHIGVEPMSEQVDFTYSVTAQGRLATPEEFEQIVVHTTQAGSIVRLKDVARVELGAQTLQLQDHAGRQAGGFHGRLPAAGRQCARDGQRGRGASRGAVGRFSERHGLRHPIRHDPVREGVDRGSRQDADRGDDPGVLRRARVPAELARHDHPDAGGAGVAHRHVRSHVPVRLLDQHADAVRHGARDRHRRRRCDRRARERRAHHDDREAAGAGSDDEGDGRRSRAR